MAECDVIVLLIAFRRSSNAILVPFLRQDNNLKGIIGPQFSKLQHLYKLYIQNNNLEGGVEAMQLLSSLRRVNVEHNQLTGTLPFDMGKLKKLEEVRMGQNQLGGHIPSSLFRSESLLRLDLHGNDFTGELEVHQASILQYLYLFDNSMSGELDPNVFCNVADTLIDLRLNNNSFAGKLPGISCRMEQLELLSLAQNSFTGPIHDTMGDVVFPSLKEIHLFENKLLSTIPGSIFSPVNLTAVLLGYNELTGTLSTDLVGDARNLAHFYVNSNKLSGKLDDFAGSTGMGSLKKLRMEFNKFSGTIPKLNQKKTLELLYLYNNSFTGTLDNIVGFDNLRKLKVSNNTFEGDLSPELGTLKNLEVLSLNGNKFKGIVPTQLQQLTALSELRIEHNDISGVVPQGVCDLRKSSLTRLVSDCGGKKVSCSCCSECF